MNLGNIENIYNDIVNKHGKIKWNMAMLNSLDEISITINIPLIKNNRFEAFLMYIRTDQHTYFKVVPYENMIDAVNKNQIPNDQWILRGILQLQSFIYCRYDIFPLEINEYLIETFANNFEPRDKTFFEVNRVDVGEEVDGVFVVHYTYLELTNPITIPCSGGISVISVPPIEPNPNPTLPGARGNTNPNPDPGNAYDSEVLINNENCSENYMTNDVMAYINNYFDSEGSCSELISQIDLEALMDILCVEYLNTGIIDQGNGTEFADFVNENIENTLLDMDLFALAFGEMTMGTIDQNNPIFMSSTNLFCDDFFQGSFVDGDWQTLVSDIPISFTTGVNQTMTTSFANFQVELETPANCNFGSPNALVASIFNNAITTVQNNIDSGVTYENSGALNLALLGLILNSLNSVEQACTPVSGSINFDASLMNDMSANFVTAECGEPFISFSNLYSNCE